MRITGGNLRGRVLSVPAGVRPTQDMVRQAVFSAVATKVEGARVLDLFAGTGALGLEAWSRGAASVCWVEEHPRTCDRLKAVVLELTGGEAGARVVRGDALRFMELPVSDEGPYDLVLADPPYDRDASKRWLEKTLRGLLAGPIVAPDALLVFEMSAGEVPAEHPGWAPVWDRTYGDSRVVIYRRSKIGDGRREIVHPTPDTRTSSPP